MTLCSRCQVRPSRYQLLYRGKSPLCVACARDSKRHHARQTAAWKHGQRIPGLPQPTREPVESIVMSTTNYLLCPSCSKRLGRAPYRGGRPPLCSQCVVRLPPSKDIVSRAQTPRERRDDLTEAEIDRRFTLALQRIRQRGAPQR